MIRHLVLTILSPLVFVSFAYGHTDSCPAENSFGTLWTGAEHLYLADRGFSEACSQLQMNSGYCQSNSIPRKDKKVSLSYGQLVAVGDFYLKEDLPFEENGNSEISNGGLKRIFKCIDESGKVHEEQREKPEVDYPSCGWVVFLNSRNPLKTVSSNIDHFGWHNMKAYVRIHEKALQEAKLAGELRERGLEVQSDFHLRKALFLNGFADHFLTDAFPAGHVRVPRKQLKKWGKEHLGGIFKKYKGDILSMMLHDSEGKNSQGQEIGFAVKNSQNTKWRTRSDSKLHECRQEDHIGVRLPAEAVKASVVEVLRAYEFGELPTDIFAATYLVPFADDQGLTAKFRHLSQDEGLNGLAGRLRSGLPSLLRLAISERDVRRMLRNLDTILENFRNGVRQDLERNPELRKRLPNNYIDAFQNLN